MPEIGGLPPPVRNCDVCGKPFHGERNLLTCSPQCLMIRRRQRHRDNYYRRVAADPKLASRVWARRRERAKTDPEFAAKLKRWSDTRWKRHREMMKTDPGYAAKHRERAKAHYAIHAETILANRRARLQAMSIDELDRWLERARRYNWQWRRKWRAELTKRPEDHQRYIDFMREYQHQLARRKLMFEATQLERTLTERQSNEH